MDNKGKTTYLELIIIILIIVELLWYIANSFGWLNNKVSTGNDGLYENTALSVAKTNSLNGIQCPVNECEKGSVNCTHYTSQGYIGYFDSVSNTIVGVKPKGYNSSSANGTIGQYVLRITCNEGDIKLDWVLGNND